MSTPSHPTPKDNGGAAFPGKTRVYKTLGMTDLEDVPGMTLRDWFAGQALAGIIFGERDPHASAWDARVWAAYAYAAADACIAERNK